MGLAKKEKQKYMEGMKFALRLAMIGGVDYLQKEILQRENSDMPLNVSKTETIAIAREHMEPELRIIATALATTVTEDLKLPPSLVVEFLKGYNDRCDLYRYDTEKFQEAQKKLDNMESMNIVIDQYNKGER